MRAISTAGGLMRKLVQITGSLDLVTIICMAVLVVGLSWRGAFETSLLRIVLAFGVAWYIGKEVVAATLRRQLRQQQEVRIGRVTEGLSKNQHI